MQEAGFAALDLDARYVTFEPPKDAGAEAVRAAEVLGLDGLNVTIPFKRDVMAAVDADAMARQVGAVNTIVFDTDPPRGYNTDIEGAVRALTHHDVTIEGTEALVIGAGGAGRGVAFGLANEGANVRIANRTEERACDLAEELPEASAFGLAEVAQLVEEADLVINATSVGMKADESLVPADAFQADQVVMDVVYQPLTTTLLRDAAAAGAQTIDGAWMLLFQGVAAFEHWTGRDAPVDEMNRALRNHL